MVLKILILSTALLNANTLCQDKPTSKELIEHLGDNNPDKRLEALRALIRLDYKSDVEPLLKSKDEDIKRQAETIIKTLKLFEQIPQLKKIWENNPTYVEGMPENDVVKIAQLVCKELRENKELLSESEQKDLFKKLLQNEKVLAELKQVSRNNTIHKDEDSEAMVYLPLYIEALEHKDNSIVYISVNGLTRLVPFLNGKQKAHVIKSFLEKLDNKDKTTVKCCSSGIINIFSNLEVETQKVIVDHLLKNLNSESNQVSFDSSYLLSRIATQTAEEVAENIAAQLINNLDNKDKEIRKNVYYALGGAARNVSQKTLNKVVKVLMSKFEDKDETIRTSAIKALSSCSNNFTKEMVAHTVKTLLAKVDDKSPLVCKSIAQALVHSLQLLEKDLLYDETIKSLFDLLKNKDLRSTLDIMLREIAWTLQGELCKSVRDIVNEINKETKGELDYLYKVLNYKDKTEVEGILEKIPDKEASRSKVKFKGKVGDLIIVSEKEDLAKKLNELFTKKVKVKGSLIKKIFGAPFASISRNNNHLFFLVDEATVIE